MPALVCLLVGNAFLVSAQHRSVPSRWRRPWVDQFRYAAQIANSGVGRTGPLAIVLGIFREFRAEQLRCWPVRRVLDELDSGVSDRRRRVRNRRGRFHDAARFVCRTLAIPGSPLVWFVGPFELTFRIRCVPNGVCLTCRDVETSELVRPRNRRRGCAFELGRAACSDVSLFATDVAKWGSCEHGELWARRCRTRGHLRNGNE